MRLPPAVGIRPVYAIAAVLPLSHFTEATRNVMVHHEPVWHNLGSMAVVVGWGLVGLVGAIRGFRWQPVESL